MKNLKKVLALVLAFACAFTMFAGAAFTDQADINADNVDAVDLLTTLGIIKGYEDGSFDPEGVVTRAEMAKMIYSIRNGGNDDASAHVGNTTSFTDISGHWAEGYIKYLQNTGIVAGKSATKFVPNSQVTTVEAMKMALALAGYDEKNAGLTGADWSKNTLTYATTIGLTDNVASAMSAGCSRQDAAQILANCLGTTAVRYSSVVENFVNDSKTGLSFGGPAITVGYKWMDLWTSIGTLVGIDAKELRIDPSDADYANSDKDDDGNMVVGFIDVDTDYSELLGQKVKVLFEDGKNNTVIGVYATVDNTVYTVEANDTSKDEEKVSFGGESYRLDDEGGIVTYIDGDSEATWTTLDQLDKNTLNPNMYTFVDTDDNGRLDTLVVRTYDVAKVSYVASDRVIAGGHTYKYDDEIIADGIEKDDWVVITHDMYNDCWNVEPVDVQTADLVGMRDNKDITNANFDVSSINRTVIYDEYQIGDNWYAGGENAVASDRSENDLKNVKAVQAVDYVAVNGIMFYIERSSGTNTGRVDNVAVVLATTKHWGVADEARIAFFNGDTKVVTIEGKSVEVVPGNAYEYRVIGDEYRFSDLQQGVTNKDYEEYYGDLTYRGDKVVGTSVTIAEMQNNDRFDGVTIDDDAQILLYKVDGINWDVACITGKQFKGMSDLTNIDKAGHGLLNRDIAYGFSGEMNGLNRIGALALQVEDNTNLDGLGIPTWSHYGYILTGAKWVDDLNVVAEYELFTDDGRRCMVREELGDLNERPEGGVLGYNGLTSATLSRAAVEDVEEGTYEIDGAVLLNHIDGDLQFSAITKVSDDGETVIFAENGVEKDISGATIIYVDTKNGAGVVDGDVKTAIRNYNATNNPYMANALYIESTGDDIELLIVDQGAYLKNDEYKNYVVDNGVVYGEDKAPAAETKDYVDLTYSINKRGALNVSAVADRPDFVPADASIDVYADVYVDGAFSEQAHVIIPENKDSAIDNTLEGYYDEDDKIDLRDVEIMPSKVKVEFRGLAVKDGATATLSTSKDEVISFFVDTTDTTKGIVTYTITGLKSDNVTTPTMFGRDIAANAKHDFPAKMAAGNGPVIVTLFADLTEQYTFTGLTDANMAQFGADAAETATLTIAPARTTVNGGSALQLTASLSSAPSAANKYVVTVKVGGQTLTWTLDDNTVKKADKALTINNNVKLDATNVTVEAIDMPNVAKNVSGNAVVNASNGGLTWTVEFDMDIKLVDATKVSAKHDASTDIGDISVKCDGKKLIITGDKQITKTGSITINAGAVCAADDATNTNDAQTLNYNGSWTIAN